MSSGKQATDDKPSLGKSYLSSEAYGIEFAGLEAEEDGWQAIAIERVCPPEFTYYTYILKCRRARTRNRDYKLPVGRWVTFDL
ncbi:MAG: hypothetical protein KKB82_04475 [Candidatus Omnitrophica bacterium]|nr:hypothetical protein [Candidatus Omnitrophota bacterium]MBU1925161.1 hypothetical protein [Candidatus Omnitrophota bacterium]